MARSMAERIADDPSLIVYNEESGQIELGHELESEFTMWVDAEAVRTAGVNAADEALHKDLARDLSRMKLKFTERDDIVDFPEYRRSSENHIRFNNETGYPVDSYYADLASRYPGIFDERKYSSQADQVQHINEVYRDTMFSKTVSSQDRKAVEDVLRERLQKRLKKELGIKFLTDYAPHLSEEDILEYLPF